MELRELAKGVKVEVIKGRKIPIGTKGVIKWWSAIAGHWEQSLYGWKWVEPIKIGIKVEGCDRLMYTYPQNLKVIE